MINKFTSPDFTNGGLEVRESETEIEIYFSGYGLLRFIGILETLAKKGSGSHIHIEDWEILTPATKNVTLALRD